LVFTVMTIAFFFLDAFMHFIPLGLNFSCLYRL
jgi:hypothetical protein